MGRYVLMPDHLHALLSFHPEKSMSMVVGNWKKFHSRCNGVVWQDNYRYDPTKTESKGVVVNQ